MMMSLRIDDCGLRIETQEPCQPFPRALSSQQQYKVPLSQPSVKGVNQMQLAGTTERPSGPERGLMVFGQVCSRHGVHDLSTTAGGRTFWQPKGRAPKQRLRHRCPDLAGVAGKMRRVLTAVQKQ